MVINPPLILVSALFFLALSAVLYVGAWIAATIILWLGRRRLAHASAKRVLMTALILPAVLAAALTIGGATFQHSHATPEREHHNMLCQEMFAYFSHLTSVHGNLTAGIAFNGLAWALAGLGLAYMARAVIATIRLERGLAPFLESPSPKLAAALERMSPQMPRVSFARFYECAVPAAYSSVFGLFRVRCVLSRDFVQSATDAELAAVVAHEAEHLRAGDAWATLLVGAVNCLFFTLRPVRLLSRRWRREAELACDDAAVAATREPLAMASAILRVSGIPVAGSMTHSLPATTLAFADDAACPPSVRVERLIAQAEKAAAPMAAESPLRTAGSWAFTLLLAGLGLAMLASAQAVCFAHCSLELVARALP